MGTKIDSITAGIFKEYLSLTNKPGASVSPEEFLLFRQQAVAEVMSGITEVTPLTASMDEMPQKVPQENPPDKVQLPRKKKQPPAPVPDAGKQPDPPEKPPAPEEKEPVDEPEEEKEYDAEADFLACVRNLAD